MSDMKEKMKGAPETADNNVISSSGANRKGGKKKSALITNEGGALVSGKAELNKKATVTEKKPEGVALYSTKNVSWQGVGSLKKGYNIVSEQEASKWKTRNHVRPATPEEVAAAYGK